MEKLLLVGGGGHCKVVIGALRAAGRFEIAGIIDLAKRIGERVEGVAIVGGDADLKTFFEKGVRRTFVAIGSLGDTGVRRRLVSTLQGIGFAFPPVIHPTAWVAPSVETGPGVFVSAGTVLQPGVKIGDYAIVNTGALVDHDCVIGPFAHIAPGVVLSGGVTVGADAHIGTGSSVIERRTIGRGALIGAGSVVVSDIPENCKAFGNPCRVVSSLATE